MSLSRYAVRMLSVAVMVLGAGSVCSQDFPTTPIRITTGAAGGGNDFTSRLLGEGLAAAWGQPVVIDNRPAIPATEAVLKSPPDGYSLLVAGSALWTVPLLQKVSYDAVRDFSPLSLLVREARVLAIHPSVPAKSVKELIALAKARPGELNYASTGVGTASHFAPELFKAMAGINMVHIPFKGTAQAVTAQIGGEIQVAINEAGSLMPHARSGKLRALAVTSLEPSKVLPELPTVSASGLPGFESISITNSFAPAKTPTAIITRLHQEIVRVLNKPDVRQKFFDSGAEIVASSPDELGNRMKSEIPMWTKIIKDAGIRAE